jgi:hypothetical protein
VGRERNKKSGEEPSGGGEENRTFEGEEREENREIVQASRITRCESENDLNE